MTENPAPPPSPIRVSGRFDDELSRGLWLVKWLLLIPHLIVLAVLGAVFWVLTVVAFFAILVTGRYPRAIFGFNVGVLRWGWRVVFYGYGANGTDRYPPFTLADVPDYPARLDVDHPERLSRGLVLVKWWLLALPHYLVLVLLLGSGSAAADGTGSIAFGAGLITLLVLFAVVALLFTGRYPRGIADLVVGLDRWVLRVLAYASLMTDDYPPFRLDQGQDEPPEPEGPEPGPGDTAAPGTAAVPTTTAATATPGSTTVLDRPTAPPAPPVPPPVRRTTPPPSGGRIALLIVGSLVVLLGLGGLGAGATGLAADQGARNPSGYLTLGPTTSATAGVALRTDPMTLSGTEPASVLGSAQVTATSRRAGDLFVGIAPSADVTRYLAGAPQGVWRGAGDGGPAVVVAQQPGTTAVPPPATQPFWAAQAVGSGTQSLTWTPAPGQWTLVVMNADGSAPVVASVSAGVQAPGLGPLAVAAMVAGGALVVLGVLGIALGARPRRKEALTAG